MTRRASFSSSQRSPSTPVAASPAPSRSSRRSSGSQTPSSASSRPPRVSNTGSRSTRARASQVDHLQNVLCRLQERDVERQQELDQFSSEQNPRIEELSPSCPILEGIVRNGGPEAVTLMCNFSPRELHTLWMSVRAHVVRYWNVGRGKRSQFAAKDVFFMLLVVVKCGGTWEMLSNVFQIKTPTFIKTIVGFLEVVAPKMYDKWVAEYAGGQKMRSLVTSGHTFQHRPCALYATDVAFQQSNRPSGSMAESMPWYSAKHKLYGFKVEVSVNPRGLAINCTRHSRGNTADITMFRENQAFHLSARRKADGEHRMPDNGHLQAKYPDEWAVLADEGYQGLADHV